MFENPTTAFSCNDIIFWVFCSYSGPFHFLCLPTRVCGASQSLVHSDQAIGNGVHDLRTIVLKTFHCCVPQGNLQVTTFQARQAPASCAPRVFFINSGFLWPPLSSSCPQTLGLNCDIRKPNRRWRNGVGHNNSLHLAQGQPYGKELFILWRKFPKWWKYDFGHRSVQPQSWSFSVIVCYQLNLEDN